MTILDDDKVDHLIVLVGGNPLPNYVAARLLAKHGATLHLVHTLKTYGIAQRLATCLSLPAEALHLGGAFKPPQFVQVDERDPRDIFAKISALFELDRGSNRAAIPRGQRVGLHYTSGNRPMSVHAYDAVEAKRGDAVFSYLDAGRLEMLIHDAARITRAVRADKLLNMTLETLFKLQGLKESSHASSATPLQPGLAAVLAELHTTDEGAKAWFDWRRNGSDGWKKLPKNQPKLAKVEAVLRQMCGGEPTPQQIADALGYDSLPDSTVWWKSKWLEDHVLAQLQIAIVGREDTNDARKGVQRIREGHGDRDFDLDVVVMRAYQLFAFSCIVSNDPQSCKDHLMEAYVRVRQAGGDEARVGLVCLYKEAQALQKEITGDLDAEGKVRVFGQADLLILKDRITEWLDRQP